MNELKSWSRKTPKLEKDPNLCLEIDGICASGKSTFMTQDTRKQTKVNNVFSNISNHKVTTYYNYNVSPMHSFIYLIESKKLSEENNTVKDRSFLSNLVFYLVHTLIGAYKSNIIKGFEYDDALLFMTEYANHYELKTVANWLFSKKPTNIVFFINTQIDILKDRLYKRGVDTKNVSDIVASQNDIYLISQNHAYRFFAEYLNIPCFDLKQLNIGDYLDNYKGPNNIKFENPFENRPEDCNFYKAYFSIYDWSPGLNEVLFLLSQKK